MPDKRQKTGFTGMQPVSAGNGCSDPEEPKPAANGEAAQDAKASAAEFWANLQKGHDNAAEPSQVASGRQKLAMN